MNLSFGSASDSLSLCLAIHLSIIIYYHNFFFPILTVGLRVYVPYKVLFGMATHTIGDLIYSSGSYSSRAYKGCKEIES